MGGAGVGGGGLGGGLATLPWTQLGYPDEKTVSHDSPCQQCVRTPPSPASSLTWPSPQQGDAVIQPFPPHLSGHIFQAVTEPGARFTKCCYTSIYEQKYLVKSSKTMSANRSIRETLIDELICRIRARTVSV